MNENNHQIQEDENNNNKKVLNSNTTTTNTNTNDILREDSHNNSNLNINISNCKNKPPTSPKIDSTKRVDESKEEKNVELHVDVSVPAQTNSLQCQKLNNSNPSPVSAATSIHPHTHIRAPVLSASDAAHSCASSAPFVRGTFVSSTISGSDLHRFLNSGYLNGENYLSRGVEPKFTKSPHFHRPPNFSYSKNTPNFITPSRSSNRGNLSRLF